MKKNIVSLALLLTVIFTIGLYVVITPANTDENVQVILADMLGDAYTYGLFVEEFSPSNHNQTTFATNKLIASDQWLSAWFNYPTGTIFFNSVTGKEVKLDKNVASKLVLGQDYSIDFNTNEFVCGDTSININNCSDIDIYYRPNYLDITTILSTFEHKDFGNNYVKIDLTDSNNSKVNIKDDKQICVINITQEELDKIQSGGLKIEKRNSQIIVFNVTNINNNLDLSKEYYVNGIASSNDNNIVADTVIWNLSDFDGKVKIGNFSGILIAPRANVELIYTSRGRVIANSFTNIGGEFHFISELTKNISPTNETKTELETKVIEITTVAEETTITEQHITDASTENTTVSNEKIISDIEETTTESTIEITTSYVEHTTTNDEMTSISENMENDIEYYEIEKSDDNAIIRKTPEVAANESYVPAPKTGDDEYIMAYILLIIFAISMFYFYLQFTKRY